jgi:hypothetical protein
MMTADEIRANRARRLANAKQQLAETKEEITLFEQGNFAWERKFKLDFPGSGYAAAMRAQAARLELEIARHEQADREARSVTARSVTTIDA